MCRRHVRKQTLPTHFISKRTSPYDVFNVCINSPSSFNFPHSRYRNIVFSSTEKAQGLDPWSLDLDPLLNGLKAHLASIMKRPKPTYHIKTRRELIRWKSLNAHMRKPRCPIKDSLHGALSKVSSPPAATLPCMESSLWISIQK